MRIVLASQSKIRKRALDLLGLKYECIPAGIDEKSIRHTDPLKMAQILSEAKAKEVSKHHRAVIIASDAFLVFNGQILEKPRDLQEAHRMLKGLSGSQYTFVTGLAVHDPINEVMHSTAATCDVHFREISDREISDYMQRYPVLDFAGAHETDGIVRFSKHISGNCNFVTALPMTDLIAFLRKAGVEV